MASAATPICLGEWSGTGEASKDLSKEISFFFYFKKKKSLVVKVFEQPTKCTLSNFHVGFLFFPSYFFLCF